MSADPKRGIANPYLVSARSQEHFEKLCKAVNVKPEKAVFVPFEPIEERREVLRGRKPFTEAMLVGPFSRGEIENFGLIPLEERLTHAIHRELNLEQSIPSESAHELARTFAEWLNQAVSVYKGDSDNVQ